MCARACVLKEWDFGLKSQDVKQSKNTHKITIWFMLNISPLRESGKIHIFNFIFNLFILHLRAEKKLKPNGIYSLIYSFVRMGERIWLLFLQWQQQQQHKNTISFIKKCVWNINEKIRMTNTSDLNTRMQTQLLHLPFSNAELSHFWMEYRHFRANHAALSDITTEKLCAGVFFSVLFKLENAI